MSVIYSGKSMWEARERRRGLLLSIMLPDGGFLFALPLCADFEFLTIWGSVRSYVSFKHPQVFSMKYARNILYIEHVKRLNIF